MREVHFFLAKCLCIRYDYTLNDELDEAASILDEIIASSSPGDEFVAECQKLVPTLAILRSMADRHPEHSEEVIYRARVFLASSSPEDPLYPIWSRVLERASRDRYRNFGPISGLKGSPSDSLPSRQAKSDHFKPDDFDLNTRTLDGLLNEVRNNNITDIEDTIEFGRSILASSNPSYLPAPRLVLILLEAFERTENIEYLDDSIHTLHEHMARRQPKLYRICMIFGLLASLYHRSRISRDHRLQDQREMVELLAELVNSGSQSLSLRDRFHSAYTWALFARASQYPSASTAYETALSLMQDFAPFSPTLQLQHSALVACPAHSHEIPLDYASYLVDLGQVEQAIETLERGRALLWSEMRHLRTSIDQLLDADPDLGHKFAALNRELEELTKSVPPSHSLSTDDVVTDDLRAGDQLGNLLRKQRGLLKERDKVISQIRTLPGFDRFLTFSLFDTLRSATSSGPVIIINHCNPCSDILILLHNASPSLMLTADDFYFRARALKDKLLTARVKDGLDSSQYDEALASILTELYELVGKPVIERLRTLQVPDQSRIWWCPTSVFCLPLHAMGPIPSDDGELRYFMDLYISSYTPSLSALIQSRIRDSSSRSSDRPSVLLVAQTDPSLPTVGGEIQVVRALDTEVTSLISEAATPAAVLNGFHRHQFVHFACHRTLEVGKPFEAGFELYGEERLMLLKIVRADLPTGEQETPYHERSAKALQFAVKKLRKKRRITLERLGEFRSSRRVNADYV